MKTSAGLLMFRHGPQGVEVLLAHPGGPWWQRKDAGAWTLPKGEYLPPEAPLDAALREWGEETGFPAEGPFAPLGDVRLASGKRITAWAFEGDADPALLRSNSFAMEWPPRSGRIESFPEVDRVAWFGLAQARQRISTGQAPFIDRLASALGAS